MTRQIMTRETLTDNYMMYEMISVIKRKTAVQVMTIKRPSQLATQDIYIY